MTDSVLARFALGAYLALVLSGCDAEPEPTPPPRVPARPSGRVLQVEPPAETPTLGAGLTLGGIPGYLRATLIVERPADPRADTSARSALYDSLFPVGSEARLRVVAAPPTPPATAPRLLVLVDSAGTTSEAFVEPKLPLFASGATIRWTPALGEGDPLPDSSEVEVGRWTISAPGETVLLILRVVGSRQPIGPRLRGLGSSAS